MELESSPIYNEVLKITEESSKPVSFYWTAEIHTDDLNIDIFKVTTINTFRDYEKNFGDEISLETAIPLGVYAKIIYPNRNKLEITLIKTALFEAGDRVSEDEPVESERYKAVLVLDGLPPVEGTEMGQMDQFSLDLKDILKINFQLFNRSLEKLRLVTVGGIFRRTKAEDVIRGNLARESARIKIIGEKAIEGVDIVDTTNKENREHIVIPQGTKLIRVPTFIQERCGGMYNAGIGTYLQDRVWYIYPLYDTTRLLKAERTLTLIKVPKNRYTGIERTYRVEGTSLFVLGTEQSNFTDDASVKFMNKGNGVRLADARQFMGSVAKTSNNKAVISRGKLNSEFISKKKEDEVNNVQMSDDQISANPFIEYSKLMSRNGGIFEFVWENGKPTLLFPGMMTKVLYMDGDDISELNGVLLSVQTLTQISGSGMASSRHKTTTHLSVFVNKVN